MNFYESYVIKLQNRIKKIDENPDPTKLRSNRIRYEIELEMAKDQLEGWKQGKPFSDGGSLQAGILVRAMGFIPAGGVNPAFQTNSAQKYLDQARSKGLPVDKTCDMSMIPFTMMEMGDVPMETVAVCDHHCCTPMMLRGIYVAHNSDTFTYFIDRSYEEDEANLKYVVDQMKDFIRVCEEKFPGVIKYDENRLIELQKNEEEYRKYSREVHKLLMHKPSPVSGRGSGGSPTFFGATKLDVEYAKVWLEEMQERVNKGISGIAGGEKMRMMWSGITNPAFMDPYKVMAKWGIAVFRGGTRWNYEDKWNRKLSPLEKVAARAISDHRAGRGSDYMNDIIEDAKELGVDAIINYNMRGCTAALGLRRVIEERVEKELGIPILQLDGAQWDMSYADEPTITARLDEFAQMCLSNKGLA
jgi:benzoyl-CoA reductase/2-hydroxyglutaryl-CoA dehydratase subunit BcrC/BadD/HgdB